MISQEIGGYFELETSQRKPFYNNLIGINTGRNGLEYLLRANGYKRLFIPFYTCDVILEPLFKLGIEYEFYYINQDLEPTTLPNLKENEGFLYTNYFGLKNSFVKKLAYLLKNLIIDSSQAFFERPLENVDSFYSVRKFFGVPDGGYVHEKSPHDLKIGQTDKSFNRMRHLLIRTDKNARAGYEIFKKNDSILSNQPIKKMSRLTNSLLHNIDYDNVSQTRINNFNYLHKHLRKINLLTCLDKCESNGPMIYPFLSNGNDLRNRLIAEKIYVATYWPNVGEWVEKDTTEHLLYSNLIALPIDQRYNVNDMDRILNVINA